MASHKVHLLLNCLLLVTLSCSYPIIVFANDTQSEPAQKDLSDKKSTPSDSGFIFYGNWCGPNHPPDITTAPEPIDLLDKQCQTHDLCYIDKGDFNCSCDRAMVKEIDLSQKKKLFNREQYLLAQNIKIHFALSPCNGEVNGNKILPTRVLTRIYKGTKNRVLNTYDRFIGNRFQSMKRSDNIADTTAKHNATQEVDNKNE